MTIEIKLHTFNAQPGEEKTHWLEAKGTRFYPLSVLLEHFWHAPTPDFADGDAIEIRFI